MVTAGEHCNLRVGQGMGSRWGVGWWGQTIIGSYDVKRLRPCVTTTFALRAKHVFFEYGAGAP